jgi:hypothetical protein
MQSTPPTRPTRLHQPTTKEDTTMMKNDTVRKMNELKLFGMAHAFTAQVESANATHLSFEERIGLIVDHEVTYRDDKRAAATAGRREAS